MAQHPTKRPATTRGKRRDRKRRRRQQHQDPPAPAPALVLYYLGVTAVCGGMVLLAIFEGKQKADGIGLALVTAAVFILTPGIGKAVSRKELWEGLQERKWWPTPREWRCRMVWLGAAGLLFAGVGKPVLGWLYLTLAGAVMLEIAIFGLIPLGAGRMFKPLVETTQEDRAVRKWLRKFRKQKGPALVGAVLFALGSLVQFMSTLR